jgi:hypothetical protein
MKCSYLAVFVGLMGYIDSARTASAQQRFETPPKKQITVIGAGKPRMRSQRRTHFLFARGHWFDHCYYAAGEGEISGYHRGRNLAE